MTGILRHAASILVLLAVTAIPVHTNAAAEPRHFRLIDRLDRPADGYCFDVLGTPGNLRTELPLFAHNCKPRLTPDSAVEMTARGRIRFTAIDLCVTAMGVNGRALAGVPLLLRPCGRSAPFMDVGPLQAFSLGEDGRLRLRGSKLCVRVGTVSARTYSAADRWRSLYLDACATAPAKLSRWELVAAPK
jgi:hypothetical protein